MELIMSIIQIVVAIWFRIFHFGFQAFLAAWYGKRQGLLPPINDSLLTESASKLAFKIRTKQISSETLVQAFIDRIREVNPIINAVIEDRFLSALDTAREVDEQLRQGTKSLKEIAEETPFLGVPITAKNSIAIKGLVIDTGVVYRKGRRARIDSDVINRMRNAGAIPLCVTNVPELCMWMDAANKIYGRTLNPYDLNRIPGGSSGGEAALIGSAGSVIGLGNDIAGSIRSPAFSCGIFGHKPTPCTVSQEGQFPTAHDNDLKYYVSTGPLCRYAEDMLPMLKILTGNNPKLKLNEQVELRNIKVFYTEEYIRSPYTTPIHADMGAAILKVARKLHKISKLDVQCVNIPPFNKAMSIWYSKISTAKAPSFEEFLTDGRYSINPYWELFKWFLRLSDHTLQMIVFLLSWKWNNAVKEPQLSENLEILKNLKTDLLKLLNDDGVLIFPPQPEPPIFHQEQIAKMSNWGYTAIFNALGFPACTCPIGLNEEGLPLGVQVVAAPYNDRLILAVAKEIESLFGGWKEPR